MKKRVVTVMYLVTIGLYSYAQEQVNKIDSIENKLESYDTYINKIHYLIEIIQFDNKNKYELLPYAKQALKLSENLKPRDSIAKTLIVESYISIAMLEYYHQNYNQTILNLKKAIIINKQFNDYGYILHNIKWLSRAYYFLGEFDFSIYEKEKGIKIAKQIKRNNYRCFMTREIGMCYLRLNQVDKAFTYYKKALNDAIKRDDKQNIAYGYCSMGEYYFTEKQYKKSIEYLYKAIQMAGKNNITNPEQLVRLRLAEAFLKINKLDSAVIYFNRFNMTDKLKEFITNDYYNIGAKIYLKKKKFKEAVAYIDSSYRYTIRTKNYLALKNIYLVYIEIYATMHDSKKLSFYKKRLLANYDTLQLIANRRKVENVENLLKIDKFISQNTVLKQKKYENKKQIEKINLILNVSFGLILIGVVILLLIGYYLKKVKKKNAIIKKQNQLIKTKNIELNNYKKHLESIVAERTEKLLEEKERAEESDRLKTEFLKNFSHEIRTPLNGIIGFSSLLGNKAIENEKKERFISIIKDSGNQLLKIVENILEYSRITTGQIKITIMSIQVCNVITEIYEPFITKADAKGLSISLQKEEVNTMLSINTDEYIFRKILDIIIDNAVRFTDKGAIEISVCKKTDDNKIEISVKDTGIGISPEHKDLVFIPFSQEDKTISRNFGGLGLGLSIAKEYAKLLNGDIYLKSEKNKGTVFYISLPYDLNSEHKIVQPSRSRIIKKKNKYTFLIVEDEYVNYILLDALLTSIYKKPIILYAKNGKEAVKIVKNNDLIDIVLMDVKMPVMNGYEATKEIKKIRQKLPIIAQTAYLMANDTEHIGKTCFSDIIQKPIKETELKTILRKYIDN
jgi:signal transduction histidine kinase/CheY-like chemotaxis protein